MNTSIAVLGLPSSGKTSLIHSFEQNMSIFQPHIVFSSPLMRMPDLYNPFEQKSYNFTIEGKEQHTLSITEYSGDLLNKREDNVEARKIMLQSLQTQNAWIIMIDGSWFQSNQEEEIEKIIRKKYARSIVPLVSSYADANNGRSPNIMFVASKASVYLIPYLNEEGKAKFGRIVESAFGGLVSETIKPLILLSDTSIKTPLIAFFTLIFMQYRTQLAYSSNNISRQINTIDARKKQLQTKISIESGKILKSKSLIQDLERQVYSLEQERQNHVAQLRDPSKDITMRNLGISLHRLMLRNIAMLASGFENACYSYDATVEEGCFVNFWRKKTGKLNVIVAWAVFVCMIVISLRQPGTDTETFWAGILGTIVWAVIGLAVKHTVAKVLGILGVIGGFITCFGNISFLLVIGFVVWLIIIESIAKAFDKLRAKRLKIPNIRFKDELVRFYDEAVRKG